MRFSLLNWCLGTVWVASAELQSQCHPAQLPSLLNADLEDLATGLARGLFTSVDLVKAYSARILEINGTLHMVTEINPDALSIAADLDAMRAKGHLLSPLHGIPILIKNNMATGDRMQTTAGSWGLWNAKVPRDSTMAAKLRKAGVVILGKTNLSEWANFRSRNSSNGWSAHGGQTYAAYYPGQDASGSSSGSGTASDIGLALASLGSETSGSIVAPSGNNNLVGIKPTVGLTSRYMVIPISEHQDTVGPMARTVKDAAYVLQVIAGVDEHDNYTSAIPNKGRVPDYVAACKYHALAGVRIGVAWNVLDIDAGLTHAPVLDAFRQAVKQIEGAGATIVDANFTRYEEFLHEQTMMTVMLADFRTGLSAYFAELTENPHNLHSLADVRNFTRTYPAEEWPDRDTASWDMGVNQTWNNTDPRFWPAYLTHRAYAEEGGIIGALQRTNTSAILLPTYLSPMIPAIAGSPVITVPMGFFPWDWNATLNLHGDLVATGPNVPFGLSFMGPRFSEEDLIGYAYAYEQRTMHRHDVQQYIAPNIDLSDVVRSLLTSEDNINNICSKDWIEKSQEVARRPGALKAAGAPMQDHWWRRSKENDLMNEEFRDAIN